MAAAEWRSSRAEEVGDVVGVTRTEDAARDAALLSEGIQPRLRADVDAKARA